MEATTKILKGSALIEESLRLVEVWDARATTEDNLARVNQLNLLGKKSRSRTSDALTILRQRLVAPGPQVLAALRALGGRHNDFRDACYFEAARNDDTLAFIAGDLLYRWFWDKGRANAPSDEVHDDFLAHPPSADVLEWSDSTSIRVIQSALSALRLFGVLEGTTKKRIVDPHISFGGFIYVLGRLRDMEESATAIVQHPAWRWWLLADHHVRANLLEADRYGLIRFSEAGSTVRIDWLVDGLEEMVRAAA